MAGWPCGQRRSATSVAPCPGAVHAAGTALYHLGDPPGGIYGLIEGLMRVTAAPGQPAAAIHVGAPGLWTGEGPLHDGGPAPADARRCRGEAG